MKRIAYILLIFCVVACKQNDAVKMESENIEALPSMDDSVEDIEPLSSEAIGSKKLEEFIDLIKLKQTHPEFESDISLQLNKFTNNNQTSLDYPEGFSISNIEQLGKSKVISDSIEQLVLRFNVTTNSETFKDSILTEIRSKIIAVDGERKVLKTVMFLPYSLK